MSRHMKPLLVCSANRPTITRIPLPIAMIGECTLRLPPCRSHRDAQCLIGQPELITPDDAFSDNRWQPVIDPFFANLHLCHVFRTEKDLVIGFADDRGDRGAERCVVTLRG